MRDITVTHALCACPMHRGPRWLLALYFSRHPRHKNGLQSYCKTCHKRLMLAENLSPRIKATRKQYSREYTASRRRERGVPVRKMKNPTPNYGEGRITARGSNWVDAAALREAVAYSKVPLEVIERRSGLSNTTFYDALKPWRSLINVEHADAILLAIGASFSDVFDRID